MKYKHNSTSFHNSFHSSLDCFLDHKFLEPDEEAISSLGGNLKKANMGVVAHYYMDVELQGVLTAIQREQMKDGSAPRIAIADSLKMGDDAVQMCKDGATSIACLGVDFMSESVATIMARNGFGPSSHI